MKSFYTLAAIAFVTAAAGTANAQAQRELCAANQTRNAAVISAAQAAKTPAERLAILKKAIDADPRNAPCIADLALQLSLSSNVNPAAGPEEFGAAGEVPTTTDGTPAPAENPNQLNQPNGTPSASPAAPAL
jgi:hypothetical protein